MDSARKPHWTDYAACRGMTARVSVDVFFPDDGPHRCSPSDMSEAVRFAEQMFCGRCPVRTACLEKALESGQEQAGIRAATSPETRRALARTRTRAKCPKCHRDDPVREIRTFDGRATVHQICPGCGLSWTAEPRLAQPELEAAS